MSRGYSRGGGGDTNTECKVYVGDLSKDAEEKEVERTFGYYGRLKSVWVARNPPGFAFVEYEDPKDAEDAVRALDGTTVCGTRVRVEHATGKVRPKPWLRGGRGGGGSDRGDRDRDRGRASPPARGRRSYDSGERCYHCGERNHVSSDCPKERRRRRSYSRSRSRDRRRSNSRSYSRSRSRD